MEVVGFMGDDGWISCIDWAELSVAVASDHFSSDSVISAMAPSRNYRKLNSVLFCSVLFWQDYNDAGEGEGAELWCSIE